VEGRALLFSVNKTRGIVSNVDHGFCVLLGRGFFVRSGSRILLSWMWLYFGLGMGRFALGRTRKPVLWSKVQTK
jgi:hypothetical protein